MSLPPVITWDYQFAPNAQKGRNYLYATQTPFKICEQPFVMPRPILKAIGINYRRVPVVSIGKDVFCDTIPFMDALQQLLGGKKLTESPVDSAYEAWGYRSFWLCLPLVPAELITEPMAKDRKNLFPVFARTDFGSLRNNGLGEFRSMLEIAENKFLKDGAGPFIGGAQTPGMADVHTVWMIKWAFQTLPVAQDPGFGEKDWPKVFRWINALTVHNEDAEKDQKIPQEEAEKIIFGSQFALPDLGVDSTDALVRNGIVKEGDVVHVEATDAEPNTYPQEGKLVGLSAHKIVLGLDNGLRVHFPRVGYILKNKS